MRRKKEKMEKETNKTTNGEIGLLMDNSFENLK
jgi:hypothetical protein